jgi:hypothetical protein
VTDRATRGRGRPARRDSALVLLAWSLVGVGVAWREGEFSNVSLPLVLLGWLVLAYVVGRRPELRIPTTSELAAVAALVVLAAAFLRVKRYMYVDDGIEVIQGAFLLTAVAAAATLLPALRRSRVAEGGAIGLAVVTGIATIRLAEDASIDVWYLLQQSSEGLLRGDNMYEQHWVGSNGLQDVYPYLPFTTVLLTPFRWFAGDVRYGLLAAAVLSFFVARRLAPRATVPALLPLLLVVSPKWPFLINQSWTEPLLVLLLGCAVLAISRGRLLLAVVALAAALACKQHIVLILPLFALWPSFGWRRTVASGALAGAVVLPWWLMSPSAMWADAVDANLSMGVLRRALCIPSLLDRQGIAVSFAFLLLMLCGAYALVLLRVPRTPAGLALGCAFVLLTLDIANKQSFFNHYQLPLGLLVVALCASAAVPDARRPNTRSSVSASSG